MPRTAEVQNLAERFHQHDREYLRFITTPGVEPTYKLAEQAISLRRHQSPRDRRQLQSGRTRWLKHIWTALATCTQHGRSVFDFLNQAVRAVFADQTAPTLLFGTS